MVCPPVFFCFYFKRFREDLSINIYRKYFTLYAKVMEKLRVKEETIRGYNLCVKANPHTDLAKRAKKVLEKIDI